MRSSASAISPGSTSPTVARNVMLCASEQHLALENAPAASARTALLPSATTSATATSAAAAPAAPAKKGNAAPPTLAPTPARLTVAPPTLAAFSAPPPTVTPPTIMPAVAAPARAASSRATVTAPAVPAAQLRIAKPSKPKSAAAPNNTDAGARADTSAPAADSSCAWLLSGICVPTLQPAASLAPTASTSKVFTVTNDCEKTEPTPDPVDATETPAVCTTAVAQSDPIGSALSADAPAPGAQSDMPRRRRVSRVRRFKQS